MKKFILPTLLLLLIMLGIQSLYSQSACCFNTDISQAANESVAFFDTNIPDQVSDDVSCSCLNGEGGDIWLSFSATTSGNFEMLIEPLVPGTNFDYAIWQGACPCNAPPGPTPDPPMPVFSVSCNNVVGGEMTGIASDPLASFGAHNPLAFSPTLHLIAGTNYFLLVSNVQSTGSGFTIKFNSQAGIAPQVGAPNTGNIIGPEKVCKGGDATFTINPPILGANNYIWVIKNASQTQVNITQNGPTPTQTLNFPYPVGVYEVCVSGSGPQMGCFPSAQKCKTIEVVEIPNPAGHESGTFCTGEEYVAGNGEIFNVPGIYNLTYTTAQGCDSVIVLTLTQLLSDFTVTVKEVCKGECVVWGGETVCETGTYDNTLQNQDGCDSISQLVLISVPLETKVNGVDTLDCNTSSITLTSTGSVFAANPVYVWKKGNQVVGNSTSLTINTGGTYSLTISSTVSGHTCSETTTVTIVQDFTSPQNVTAIGGEINCLTTQVILMGNSTTAGATYHWSGPNGFVSNLKNPTAILPGNYVLTVKGPNGCTKTATAVVSENKVAPSAIAVANGTLNCNATTVLLNGAGSSTGSQFTYLWTTSNGSIESGSTTLLPTVNHEGTYILTVTNTSNGCTSSASATVLQLQPVTATINSTTNVACFGTNTGSITIAASGGDSNYSYTWSNGQTTGSIANLAAGNYTVVVTDGNGCSTTLSTEITQPPMLIVNATATPQTVVGVDDGTATANPTGGSGSYSYSWSNGMTSQTIQNLAPANYTVVITDSNGCTASQTVTVAAQNCSVKATVNQTNVSCNGAANGSATINLENANLPVALTWSNGETTATITGLSGGSYDVTATDADGCEVVANVLIEEPQALIPNAISTNLTAFDSNDGTASANPNGGVSPYIYLWNNNATEQTIDNLEPGSYTVIVTDANGCSAEQSVTVNQFSCAVTATIIANEISCFNSNDGQASFSISGGNAPFTYEWSTGENTASITGLSAGTFIGTVTDAFGCATIAEVNLTEPAPLGIEVLEMVEATCNSSDGSLSIVASGGTPAYSYLWESGETTALLSDLNAGTYHVSVSDANGCLDNFEIVLGTDDDVAPTVLAMDITVFLNANGQATIAPADIDNGSTDDCGIESLSLNQSDFDCSNIGNNAVELTVADVGGNISTATINVKIEDNIPPVLALQDITVTIGSDGTVAITPQMLDNGSTDNCGIVTWTLSQQSFDCDSGGPNVVAVTATDASGNVSSANVTVTVEGNTAPPTITCPSNLELPYCDPVADFDVTAINNCGGDVTLEQNTGLPSGSTYPTGTTTVSFTAINSAGGESTCSFEVVVAPAMSLSASIQDVSCFGQNDGSATITATGGTPPYTYHWSNGDDTPTSTGLIAGQYSVTITDAGGCTTVKTIPIVQPANLVTSLVDLVNSTLGQSTGSIDVTISGGVAPYTFVWKNAMGAVIGNSEDIGSLAAGNYSLLVTDASGCLSQSGYTIQNTNGTAEESLDKHVLLYPNPTSGKVTLELVDYTLKSKVEVKAFDVTGRQVLSQTVNTVKESLNFNEKPSGIYLIKIVLEGTTLTKRLVVGK